MDPNYNINGFAGSSDAAPHSYSTTPQTSSLSQRFPEQLHGSNTLPPIGAVPQAQPYPPQPFYSHAGSMPQTPITPQTSIQSTSSAPPHPTAFAQLPQQTTGPPRTLQPNPPHLPPVSSFSTPPATTIAQAAYYPTAAALGARSLSDLRPRPDGMLPHLGSQPASLEKQTDTEPTHVVGQQGRRGILPSAPGRAPPASGKSIVPIKDQDGKFPCPHCSKTYLHAKHLKRHMLRHTGDRPYQCKLCKDTFSRSDILKRHFQKCSIRRGAPADGDHLEGARVHQNKNRLSVGAVNDQHYLNSLGTPAFDPNIANHMMGGAMQSYMPSQTVPGQSLPDQPAYNDNMASISNRTSRSSSLMQPTNTMNDNRRSLSGLEHLASRTGFDNPADFPAVSSLPAGLHGLAAYAMPPSVQPAGSQLGNHHYGFATQATGAEMSVNPPVTTANGSNGVFGRSNVPNGQTQEMSWNGSYQPSGPGYQIFSGQPGDASRAIKSETSLLNSSMQASADGADANAEEGGVFTGLYSNSLHPHRE